MMPTSRMRGGQSPPEGFGDMDPKVFVYIHVLGDEISLHLKGVKWVYCTI